MTWLDHVDRLCLHVGVEFSYYDIGGTRHETSLETKVLVLSALGYDVSSIGSAAAALAAEEERPWRRVLPPFSIRPCDPHGLEVDLFIPAAEEQRHWNWLFAFEDGESVSDTFRPADLALLGAHDVEGRRIERRRLNIRHAMRPGYHRIRVANGEAAEGAIALAPLACYLPAGLEREDRRIWGLMGHLYTLQSGRNWGIGDFGDLATLGRIAAAAGADSIATNPFHVLFPYAPEAASPYSPSSRLFLNPLYVDIDAAPHAKGCAEIDGVRAQLEVLRIGPLVDYPGVWRAKRLAFEALYRRYREDAAAANAFAREVAQFAAEGGEILKRYAAFAAIEDEQRRVPWPQWPEGLRDPSGPDVRRFIETHADRIGFHVYLQYLADRQLGAAASAAREAGMRAGIIRDLALGINPDGADAWMMGNAFASGLRCGAPPDPFNPRGQEWGVLPLNPNRVRDHGELFAALVRANMRHAGGLRIDHVIGMQRQFLVPLGGYPAQGAYVRFPLEDLIGILALESHRNRCMVIGEDLGTVPAGFRERMEETNALGCAIFYFERTGDRFKAPGEYRAKAAASAATHDLPTLAGYWEGRDIETRERLGISPGVESDAARHERGRERQMVLEALRRAGLFDGMDPMELTPALENAIHAFLASSPAQVFLVQLDDLTFEKDQINVPGTIDAYPNWRRKLSVALEDPVLAEALGIIADVCRAKGRSRTGG